MSCRFTLFLILSICIQLSNAQKHKSSVYYGEMGCFDGRFTDVAQNNKRGFINMKGDMVVPCIYDEIEAGDFSPWFYHGVVPVKKNGLWGAIDTTGKVIVPFIYDTVSSFGEDGISVVTKGRTHGCINYKGEIIVPFIYERIDYLNDGVMMVKRDGAVGCLDSTGKQIIACKYSNALWCAEGLIPVFNGKKWGYINKQDSLIIPFMYDEVSQFGEGLAAVCLNGKLGFIDKKNATIVPFIYSPGYFRFSDGYSRVEMNGKTGMIDKKGKVIVPFNYHDNGWDAYVNGAFIIENSPPGEDQTFALFDSTGKAITGFDYRTFGSFGTNKFLLSNKNENKLMDNRGNLIASVKSGEPWGCNYGIFVVVYHDSISYYDSTGKPYMPIAFSHKCIDYDALGYLFFDTVAAVPYHSTWRVINRKGQFLDHYKGTQSVRLYYENGTLGTKGRLKGYYRKGKWKFYYENGKREEVVNYKNGLKTGDNKKWDTSGILIEDIIYSADTVLKRVYEKPWNSGLILESIYRQPEKAFFSNGKIKFKGKYDEQDSYNKTGKWIEGDTDKNNNYYYSEGNYVKGEKEGIWRHYNQKGDLMYTENYVDGMQQYPDGDNVIYGFDGAISEKGQMRNNKREGLWIYYDHGKETSEADYCLDELCGVTKEYFPNGKLQSVQHSVLICESGDSTYMFINPSGNPLPSNGYLRSIYSGTWEDYYENGQIKDSGSFGLKKAIRDSGSNFGHKYRFNSATDTIFREGVVIWSVKTGNWIEYYENGKIKSIGKYYPAEFERESVDTLQDENGNPKVVIGGEPLYLKDSLWKYYSENGELIRQEFYDKTKLVKVKEGSK